MNYFGQYQQKSPQTYSMVRFLSWAASFFIILSACHLGHGKEQKPQYGVTTCRDLVLETPAGKKRVGCQLHCTTVGTGGGSASYSNDLDECLTVSPAGHDAMSRGVNYTCKLGLCKQQNCHSSNLYVDCWKP
uniref:Evasin n=1 Tax=Rhipicephalus zambeziensis TaxID=60191 RepID=A0A224Y3G0_9ACAR